MTKLKLYRICEAGGWTYPPTGTYYPEGAEDTLTDWNKDDIQSALLTGLIVKIDNLQVEGTPDRTTKELKWPESVDETVT